MATALASALTSTLLSVLFIAARWIGAAASFVRFGFFLAFFFRFIVFNELRLLFFAGLLFNFFEIRARASSCFFDLHKLALLILCVGKRGQAGVERAEDAELNGKLAENKTPSSLIPNPITSLSDKPRHGFAEIQWGWH